MKRTTIYLDADMEILLKLEAMRSGRSSVEVIREALRAYLEQRRPSLPSGAGEFHSGHTDTAERFEELLDETGFGED
jgi:ribbon-helix-helix CopG family protein